MSGTGLHVWVILYENGAGYSWTDLAFWGVADSYEAALAKLTAVIGPVSVVSGSRHDEDKRAYRRGQVWRIRQVAL